MTEPEYCQRLARYLDELQNRIRPAETGIEMEARLERQQIEFGDHIILHALGVAWE